MRGRNTAASEIFKKYKSDDVTLLLKAFSGHSQGTETKPNPPTTVPAPSDHSPATGFPTSPWLPRTFTLRGCCECCSLCLKSFPSDFHVLIPSCPLGWLPVVFLLLVIDHITLLSPHRTQHLWGLFIRVSNLLFEWGCQEGRNHARRASWLGTWHEPMFG